VDTDDGAVAVAGPELLLVVRGPIAREYPPSTEVRRLRLAGLDPGYRFHLHRRGEARPLELDPAGFEFGERAPGDSSMLRMNGWMAGLAAATPHDDTFRFVTPALAPAEADAGLAAAGALRRPAGRETTPVLDNLAQFRAYSAWRAAVEARRAG
jgi:hypothetical protein